MASAELIRVPIVFTHGEADRIAAVQGTRQFFNRLSSPDHELRTYPEAYHDLHNNINQQQVVDDSESWIARQLG